MGNAIKNYERKKRREQKEEQREINRLLHNALMKECGLSLPDTFRETEQKAFNYLNR